ncbi:MAG: TolC family protein [Gemmatimonadota bacterium]|nr:TolC family protein [Gemmatimonadota bacterium]
MKLARALVLLGLTITGPQLAGGQAPPVRRLTLEQALGLAGPASEALQLARSALDRASGEVRRTRSDMLPQIAGSASYNRLLKSQFEGFASGGDDSSQPEPASESCRGFTPIPADPIAQRLDSLEQSVRCLSRANPFSDLGSLPFGRANTWSLGLSASQTLFAGGRLRAGMDAANAGRRIAAIGLTSAEAQLTLDVVTAFYDAALSNRMVAIAQMALDQADSTLAQTRLRRDVGTAPEFDLLRAGVARDNLRPLLIQATSQRDLAHLRLRQLLELPPADSLVVVADLGPDGYAHGPTIAAMLARTPDTAATHRAAVRQADESVAAQEALLAVARGESLPAVSVSSQYGKVAYPSAALPGWNEFLTNWNLTVGLQIPIFTGGRLSASREIARTNLRDAALRREQAEKGAALDARAATSQLDAASSTWQVSAGTVDQANRAYQIAEVRYREGISTQTELLDARLALQQAEANQATAARDLAIARVRLALLADLPLGGATSATTTTSMSTSRPAVLPAPTTGLGVP